MAKQSTNDMAMDSPQDSELVSETPRFDAIFAPYDQGNGMFSTEDLGNLLLDMGFCASPRVLDQALDEMDPKATGEISKLSFLEWFEENADEIEPPSLREPPRKPSRRASDEDESLDQLQSAMLDAKNMRKRVEEDVQLLSNRLQHLRNEERRAQKRMEEANRRAKEIEQLKKRNQSHQRAKQRMYEQLQQEVQQSCEQNARSAYQSRERRYQNANAIVCQRAHVVQETRLERMTYHQIIKHKKLNDQRILQERSKEIRQRELEAIKRREELKKVHEKELVRKARQNLAQEHEKRLVSEKRIHEMEAEEKRLLEKLRIAQEMQRAAYEHLDFVMQD